MHSSTDASYYQPDDDEEVTVLDAAIYVPPKQTSPPVVDISLDDPDNDGGTCNDEADSIVLEMGKLSSSFPGSVPQNSPVSFRYLENLTDWFAECIDITRNRQDHWHDIFAKHRDLFRNTGLVMQKLLSRKYEITSPGLRKYGLANSLLQLFQHYVTLCNQLAGADCETIGKTPDAELERLHCIRHLRSLHTIMTRLETTQIWKIVVELATGTDGPRQALPDSTTVATELGATLLFKPSPSLCPWFGLVLDLTATLDSSSVMQDHILSILKTSNAAVTLVGDNTPTALEYVDQTEEMQRVTSRGILKITEVFLRVVERQKPTINSDFAVKFIESLSAIWKGTMTILAQDTEVAIRPWSEAGQALDEYDFAEIQVLALYLKFARRLLAKGRLEMRVLGAFRLGDALIHLWRTTEGNYSPSSDKIRKCTADWLLEEKAVEQLLSIDSHPGLVAQSYNILGYLFVTQNWTSHLTDEIFHTIRQSQDRRLTSSIIDSLANSVNHANGTTLEALLKRMSSLPESVYSPEFAPLFLSFTKSVSTASDQDTVTLMFQIATCMLRSFVSSPHAERDEYRQAARVIAAAITQICHYESASQAVQVTCQQCVHNIKTQISLAPSSAETLSSILAGEIGVSVVDFIINDLQTLDAISHALITFNAMILSGASDSSFTVLELDSLLQLLVRLMQLKPDVNLNAETEAQLFESLVGQTAVNEIFQQESWLALSRLCRETSPLPHPFIERCIGHYLPNLSPEMFTVGLVNFTTEAIRYRLRVNDADLQEPIRIPLIDYLWTIVLRCPSDVVAKSSIKAICNFHVLDPIVRDAPSAAIMDCHEALVDRMVQQLEDCADRLRISSPDLDTSIASPTIKDSVQSLMFQRAIDCLHNFLRDVQQDPRYTLKQHDRLSASPKLRQKSTSENLLKIKYQIFPPGSAIEELEIDATASLSELYDTLRQLSRFPELRTIYAGHIIDLRQPSDQTVHGVIGKGGLLIVKNLQNDKLLPSGIDTTTSKTTAGNAVLSRFEKIYPLLDLPSNLSRSLYNLMKHFPPYVYVDATLKSTQASISQLFHPQRKNKTLYSLHCALQIVNSLDCREEEGRDCLKHIGSKLFEAFADPGVVTLRLDSDAEKEVAELFVQGLLHCLQLLPAIEGNELFDMHGVTIAARLCNVLLHAKDCESLDCGSLVRTAYDTIVELAHRCKESLATFVHSQGATQIQGWMLIQNHDAVVRQHAHRCTISLIQIAKERARQEDDGILTAFWSKLLSLVPMCQDFAANSQYFFQLMTETCMLMGASHIAHSTAHQTLDTWFRILVGHQRKQYVSSQLSEPFVCGLSRLIATFVLATKVILPDDERDAWITGIFDRLLFPRVSDSSHPPSHPTAATASVLHSDARKEMYDLVLVLCNGERQYERLLRLLQNLTADLISDDILTWEEDRYALIRSNAGYSGLRNLANTCYMNSLMTQLFMNNSFRNHIMQMSVLNEKGSQKLLAATQFLFGNMQYSQRKYADTKDLALAVKPYDSDHINVNIQMDVDEFYNLLFEQWEDQIIDNDAKRTFRSIYGGTSVTQIKSLDCQHISERTEEYLTVSCEVKGKQSLHESLQAFIAGDSMEGDNKYKCESCGSRYVNAVKRSCLKEIPDHLAFHLKRFDFDLLSMQRRKIDDYFGFPEEVDMAPYTYDAVAREGGPVPSDIFQLKGILVHSGTAEHGHYYSYIRESDHQLGVPATWLEFNDTEVTPFDPGKIPDCCFGGYFEHNQVRWSKMNSAYMLFYERKAKQRFPGPILMSANNLGPPDNDASGNFNSAIAKENDLLIRWFCLMDSEHGDFLRALVEKLQVLSQDRLSSDHTGHHLYTDMATVLVKYLQWAACRVKGTPQFEASAFALENLVLGCSQCCSVVVDLLADGEPSPQTDLLLHCPSSKVRTQTKDLLLTLTRIMRRVDGPATPPISLQLTNESSLNVTLDSMSVFKNSVDNLVYELKEIGLYCRRWHEYFSTLLGMADLGRAESVMLLATQLLPSCMMLLFSNSESDGPVELDHKYYISNVHCINRERNLVNYRALLKLTAYLLQYVNPTKTYPGDASERMRYAEDSEGLLPVTLMEHYLIYYTEVTREGREVYCLVAKGTEAIEDRDLDAQYATTIVSQMLLNCGYKSRGCDKMTSTIMHLISEYSPEFQQLPLTLAIPLCKLAPSKRCGESIIEAIKSRILLSVDDSFQVLLDEFREPGTIDPANNGFIANFLGGLAEMEAPACAFKDGKFPYRKTVLKTCHSWGPRLLQYDSHQGREKTLMVLKQILLREIKSLTGDDDELLAEEELRLQAMVRFGIEAIKMYGDGGPHRVPHSFRTQLLGALQCCIAALKDFEERRALTPVFELAYQKIADRYSRLCNQWHDLQEHYVEGTDTESNRADDGGE